MNQEVSSGLLLRLSFDTESERKHTSLEKVTFQVGTFSPASTRPLILIQMLFTGGKKNNALCFMT